MENGETAEPGADPGVSGGQRGVAVSKVSSREEIYAWVERDAAASKQYRQQCRRAKGLVRQLCGQDDGAEPGAGDTA